jgi:hypothetical protein
MGFFYGAWKVMNIIHMVAQYVLKIGPIQQPTTMLVPCKQVWVILMLESEHIPDRIMLAFQRFI